VNHGLAYVVAKAAAKRGELWLKAQSSCAFSDIFQLTEGYSSYDNDNNFNVNFKTSPN